MKNQSSERKAKLHYKSSERLCHWIKVPWLNLSGLWLQRAGFEIGDSISIAIEERKLIIKVTKKAPPEKPFWQK